MSAIPNTAAALAFLRAFAPTGPWCLTAIAPDRSSIATRTFRPGREAELAAFVAEHNGRRNLYFAVNPVVREVTKKAEKGDVASVDHLHVDLDPRAGEDLGQEQSRIRALLTERLPASVPPPTCVVFSGGGYQAFWRLAEPIAVGGDIGKAEDAERYNIALANLLGGDHCHNVDRIMRLPGTVNLPDAKKARQGREAVTAELVLHEPSRVYGIDKFRAAPAPRVGAKGAAHHDAPSGRGVDGDLAPAPISDLAQLEAWGVPDRVKVVINHGHHPDEPKQGDNSRSAWLYDVVCQLVRAGVPDDVVLGVIMSPDFGISASVLELGHRALGYARRQVERAREEVEAGPPILHADQPMRSAHEFRQRRRPTLRHYNDDWLAYDGAAYAELEQATVKAELYTFLDGALSPGKKDGPPVPFHPTKAKVANVLDALEGLAHVPRDAYAPPCWLEGGGPPPSELLACRNGLLHLPTGALLDPTPLFFTRNALEFDHEPAAPAPARWLSFLHEVWGDGGEVALLQEIIGYLLVPDTAQQKIFLLVGPRRSGKGTIGRVLTRLVGHHNTCAPSLNSLGDPFGLEPLIGRQLALIADMRLDRKSSQAAIAENLLRISGEDMITANRKYKRAWSGRLAVRFMIMTNELPRLQDASGAVASRFVPLVMQNSFLGREDPALFEALVPELPGILTWAIEGWRRLRARGHFDLPEASREAIADIHDLGSPPAAFLRECCELAGDAQTPKEEIWRAWKAWCEERDQRPGDPRHFGAQLIAAGGGRIAATKPSINGRRTPAYGGLMLRPEARVVSADEIPF